MTVIRVLEAKPKTVSDRIFMDACQGRACYTERQVMSIGVEGDKLIQALIGARFGFGWSFVSELLARDFWAIAFYTGDIPQLTALLNQSRDVSDELKFVPYSGSSVENGAKNSGAIIVRSRVGLEQAVEKYPVLTDLWNALRPWHRNRHWVVVIKSELLTESTLPAPYHINTGRDAVDRDDVPVRAIPIETATEDNSRPHRS